MTDQRTLELVSAAADGELNSSERTELEQLLENSAEAREFQAELAEMGSLLEAVPAVEPPESLHLQIVNSVTLPQKKADTSFLGWLRPPQLMPVLRYGLATAAGLLLAASFYESQSLFPANDDFDKLVGTMAPSRVVADADILDTFDFRSNGLESLIQLQRRNNDLYLDIQIDADAALDISVDMSSTGVRPGALAQLDHSLESIVVKDQTLQMRATGQRRLTVLLRRVDDAPIAEEAKIALEFSSDGRLLEQGSLQAIW
ncbi:MAG: hypothetical protein GWP02_06535 [Desulfobulbaceae bacterium]|nr:hypothetical protein [Desulfobulbaceae bacterium]